MSPPSATPQDLDWQALTRSLLIRIRRPAATVGPDGTISTANEQLAVLLGIPVPGLTGMKVFRRLSPRERSNPGYEGRCEHQLLTAAGGCFVAWVRSTRLGSFRVVEVVTATPAGPIE